MPFTFSRLHIAGLGGWFLGKMQKPQPVVSWARPGLKARCGNNRIWVCFRRVDFSLPDLDQLPLILLDAWFGWAAEVSPSYPQPLLCSLNRCRSQSDTTAHVFSLHASCSPFCSISTSQNFVPFCKFGKPKPFECQQREAAFAFFAVRSLCHFEVVLSILMTLIRSNHARTCYRREAIRSRDITETFRSQSAHAPVPLRAFVRAQNR